MITLGIIVLASVAAYLAVGWQGGVWWAARIMRGGGFDARFAALWALWTALLFWPLAMPVALVNAAIKRTLDKHDPELQRQRIRDQERRIRELERELGIKESA